MINVLSLFDGISGAQVAFDRLGIKVDHYYASEIDRYCKSITQYNYPKTIQLGDVKNWRNWNLQNIHLLIFGFPCQNFSIAGLRKGFQGNDGDLFFHAIDVLRYYNPKYFLIENTIMKKDILGEINNYIGVSPTLLDSSFFIPQSRKRLYWSNFKIIPPYDNKILLKDILERDIIIDTYANYIKDKSRTVRVGGRFEKINSRREWDSPFKQNTDIPIAELSPNYNILSKFNESKTEHSLNILNSNKSSRNKVYINNFYHRRFTITEIERLQGYNDDYTKFGSNEKGEIVEISENQRHKALGNAFTCPVIEFILSHIDFKIDKKTIT